MIAPEIAGLHPFNILARIVEAMHICGPMERGFVVALAQKAIVGRAPQAEVCEGWTWTDEDRFAVDHANACLDLARIQGVSLDLVLEELGAVIDGTFETGMAGTFLRTICAAAAAGELH
jgi:hypothetical protein